MEPNAAARLCDRLIESSPASLLVVGLRPALLAPFTSTRAGCAVRHVDWSQRPSETPTRAALESATRHELGLVVCADRPFEKPDASAIIAALRDVYAQKTWVVAREATSATSGRLEWARDELTALGLSASAAALDDEGVIKLYAFDVASYKRTPEWLNSRGWAHPQMWNKQRW